MVRILTAHRVFPAQLTGGNGIAGTSVVPGYFLNNTPRAVAAAMTFLVYRKCKDLGDFDDGVMVGPGFFEAVREEFNGRVELAKMTAERVLCIRRFFDIKIFESYFGSVWVRLRRAVLHRRGPSWHM